MSASSIASPTGWLTERRNRAWRDFAEAPPPARTSEAWRRMEHGAWRLGALTADAPSAAAPFTREVAERVAKAGGRLLTLEEAAASEPIDLERLLVPQAGPAYRQLEAANLALWRGGAFLRVPRGVRLEEPVELRFLHEDGPFRFPRVLVVAEEGSEVNVVEEHTGGETLSDERSEPPVSIAFSRVVAGPGAVVRYVYSQELPRSAVHFWHQSVELARDAWLGHVSVMLGSHRHKSELDVRLDGPGARSELRGILLGRGDQVFDPRTSQRHAAPRTASDLLLRAALSDKARSVYTGLIRVEKEAVGTDAFQANHNLLLSDQARADTTPVLEILTDAVRCKHGATAGPLNIDELFYLQTRGLPREEAARMLILGFFSPVLDKIPSRALAGRLAAKIERALAKGGA